MYIELTDNIIRRLHEICRYCKCYVKHLLTKDNCMICFVDMLVKDKKTLLRMRSAMKKLDVKQSLTILVTFHLGGHDPS